MLHNTSKHFSIGFSVVAGLMVEAASLPALFGRGHTTHNSTPDQKLGAARLHGSGRSIELFDVMYRLQLR